MAGNLAHIRYRNPRVCSLGHDLGRVFCEHHSASCHSRVIWKIFWHPGWEAPVLLCITSLQCLACSPSLVAFSGISHVFSGLSSCLVHLIFCSGVQEARDKQIIPYNFHLPLSGNLCFPPSQPFLWDCNKLFALLLPFLSVMLLFCTWGDLYLPKVVNWEAPQRRHWIMP